MRNVFADDLITRLMTRPKFGAGIGLHRMAALLEPVLASPWGQGQGRGLDAIKVTGSNGKGGTCRLAASILEALGFGTGLYTSPHLFAFNDRIETRGAPISDDALAAVVARFDRAEAAYLADHPGDVVGAFEVFTTLALYHYETETPDALVLEAGIGGRYDAIRPVPGLSVGLTSVDVEHADILGATPELIAYDKADLCPPGGTLVVGALAPDLTRRLRAYCDLRQVRLVSWQEIGAPSDIRLTPDGMRVDLTLLGQALCDVEFALSGAHQVTNALVAAGLVWDWLERRDQPPSLSVFAQAFRHAVRTVRWPGRLERILNDPPVYIDVGHTPEAMASTLAALPALAAGRPVLLVCGVSYNKDAAGIVAALAPGAARVICTRAHHRGGDPGRVEAALATGFPDLPRERIDDLPQAIAAAITRAVEEEMLVLVAGGLFLAVEAAATLRGEDVHRLRFF